MEVIVTSEEYNILKKYNYTFVVSNSELLYLYISTETLFWCYYQFWGNKCREGSYTINSK